MIDPIQLPILLKALDFLFDEGHKIMEERRERRRKQDSLPKGPVESSEEMAAHKPETAIESKQDLLESKVDEILWHNHEQELQHLVRLLETYSGNYHLAREQYAKWGDALVPAIIVNNLKDSETSMIETLKRLEAVLSRVYKKDIAPIQ